MQYLDQQIVEQALSWLGRGEPVWLCTVLSTFGSSPREPGSMMAACINSKTGRTEYIGTLSGGCVEEDLLERLLEGEFSKPAEILRYGAGPNVSPDEDPSVRYNGSRISLPCGGILDVLIEKWHLTDGSKHHVRAMLDCLNGHDLSVREINLATGQCTLSPAYSTSGSDSRASVCIEKPMLGRVERNSHRVKVQIGPAHRLIIAGLSTVARACAEFAVALGYEVIVCEPREEEYENFSMAGVTLEKRMPSTFISKAGNCHSATAVVAMTHDPRIDDLAMMEAVKTPAFYIGVMGSRKSSDARAARLMRTGDLSAEQVERLHMPIGLALGSKTPAEIALAVMADIVRVQKGRSRYEL